MQCQWSPLGQAPQAAPKPGPVLRAPAAATSASPEDPQGLKSPWYRTSLPKEPSRPAPGGARLRLPTPLPASLEARRKSSPSRPVSLSFPEPGQGQEATPGRGHISSSPEASWSKGWFLFSQLFPMKSHCHIFEAVLPHASRPQGWEGGSGLLEAGCPGFLAAPSEDFSCFESQRTNHQTSGAGGQAVCRAEGYGRGAQAEAGEHVPPVPAQEGGG